MKKILIVDDNATGKVVRRTFEGIGYKIFEACDGVDALESASNRA